MKFSLPAVSKPVFSTYMTSLSPPDVSGAALLTFSAAQTPAALPLTATLSPLRRSSVQILCDLLACLKKAIFCLDKAFVGREAQLESLQEQVLVLPVP